MKKQVITLVGVLSLVLVAGSAFAQTVYIRGKIPFDFIVGKTTLPSGAYEIRSLNDGPDKMLLLRGPDSHSNVMVSANRVDPSRDRTQPSSSLIMLQITIPERGLDRRCKKRTSIPAEQVGIRIRHEQLT